MNDEDANMRMVEIQKVAAEIISKFPLSLHFWNSYHFLHSHLSSLTSPPSLLPTTYCKYRTTNPIDGRRMSTDDDNDENNDDNNLIYLSSIRTFELKFNENNDITSNCNNNSSNDNGGGIVIGLSENENDLNRIKVFMFELFNSFLIFDRNELKIRTQSPTFSINDNRLHSTIVEFIDEHNTNNTNNTNNQNYDNNNNNMKLFSYDEMIKVILNMMIHILQIFSHVSHSLSPSRSFFLHSKNQNQKINVYNYNHILIYNTII